MTHRTTLNRWLLIAPLGLALVIRLFVIFYYGPNVSIHSDDMGYYHSAEWLLQYGIYAYYTPLKPTVHMLPGMTLLLAGVIAVFGKGVVGLYVGKIVFTLIGVFGIFGVFKSVEYMFNRSAAFVVALFLAIYIPSILTDTLFLTEPPFMAAFAWAIYYVFKAADSHRLRHMVGAALFFMTAVYFRPNVILWVIVVLFYFIVKRYPFKKLVGHVGVVAGIAIVCLLPWWIRNELVFHHFIALTDDAANPLLLGTFQGLHYPYPYNQLADEHRILAEHPNLRPQQMHEIAWFKAQQHEAVARIKKWHHEHPGAFWESYLWLKPTVLWHRGYEPIPILGIRPNVMNQIQPWILWFSLSGHIVALFLAKGKRLQLMFFALTLLYFTGIFSIFFAYERYNEPIMWLMFTGVPAGVWAIWRLVVRGRLEGGEDHRVASTTEPVLQKEKRA